MSHYSIIYFNTLMFINPNNLYGVSGFQKYTFHEKKDKNTISVKIEMHNFLFHSHKIFELYR